jgi:hypothetical protein
MTKFAFEKVALDISARVSDLDILDLSDDAEVLDLKLEDSASGRRFHLQFEGYLAYRKYLENHALRLVEQKMAWEDKSWFLYKSDQSDFIEWFKAQSFGINDNLKHMHYCLFSVDYVVDILCIGAPKLLLIRP